MKQGQLKSLLQELIDKEVSLDQSAKILWQMRYYLELKETALYYATTGQEAKYEREGLIQRSRSQLYHYLVSNGIKSINIQDL